MTEEINESIQEESNETAPEEKNELQQAVEREAELRDQFVRLAADFDNFRKQSRKEREDLRRFGIERLVLDILPVIDNLQRALNHSDDKDNNPVIQGVRMVAKQFESVLNTHGVQSFESLGLAFDPLKHEAIGQIPTVEYAKDTVAAEIEKGYMLHDKLLRPAKVMVAIPAK